MNAADGLKETERILKDMNAMLRKNVAVGLPKEKVGGAVYGDGQTIFDIGVRHEYGYGYNPRRSYLRMPFDLKRAEMAKFIAKQTEEVILGKPVEQGLGLIGVKANNIILEAFKTGGFGKWAKLDPATEKAKGSSVILVDTGVLKNSISWIVRQS